MLGDSFPLSIWISLNSLVWHWYIHVYIWFLNLHAMNTNFHYTNKKQHKQTVIHNRSRIQSSTCHMLFHLFQFEYYFVTAIFGVTSDHCPIGRPTPGRGNFLEASVAFPLQQRREEVIGVKGLWWWSCVWMGRRFPVDKHRFAYLVSMRVHLTEVSKPWGMVGYLPTWRLE